MKKHQGIRPQDIVILLKIVTLKKTNWFIKDLAHQLKISQSEVSESLHRSLIAGFVDKRKRSVDKDALIEFLAHGLKYTFPEEPGKVVSGISAAYSAAPLYNLFRSQDSYVWPHPNGTRRGQYIRPLHKNLPDACMQDDKLYELVALSDVVRLGNKMDKEKAVLELKKRIQNLN